jgi:energy-coupling factor transport system substrate-specific component
VGVKLAVLAGALVAATPISGGASFLQTRQLSDGSFAERGQPGYPQLTAWATLGLTAARTAPRARGVTIKYLAAKEAGLTSPTDIALVALAEEALGQNADRLLARLRALQRADGSVGGLVNGTAWSVLAFRGSGTPVQARTIRWLLSRQTRVGGWGWSARGAADSNDTAAVVEALRSANVTGRPISRALGFLLRFRNPDGGFELTRGRGSDAQSTAWAVQAFAAAGKAPPRGALAYLRRLRRPDGSFRYSTRYATTPVWVTAQVLPALARKAFPLTR